MGAPVFHDITKKLRAYTRHPMMSGTVNIDQSILDAAADEIERLRDALSAEREACAKIAEDRAKVCRSAYDAGDKTEVHPLNEALHIAQLIRNRNK